MTEMQRQIGFSLLLAGVVTTVAYAAAAAFYPIICYFPGNRGDLAETFYFVVMGAAVYGMVRLLREQPVSSALALDRLRADRITALFVLVAVGLQVVETGALLSGAFISSEELVKYQKEASVFGALNAMVLAHAFEELVFRGFLYARIERFAGFVPALTLVVSRLRFLSYRARYRLRFCHDPRRFFPWLCPRPKRQCRPVDGAACGDEHRSRLGRSGAVRLALINGDDGRGAICFKVAIARFSFRILR